MELKRNEIDDRWNLSYSAWRLNEELFSSSRWGVTPNWSVILEQTKKIENIAQNVDIDTYPSQIFVANLELLEANLYMLDDIIYYCVGGSVLDKRGDIWHFVHEDAFWNLDCHNEITQIYHRLEQIYEHLINQLSRIGFYSIKKLVLKELGEHDKNAVILDGPLNFNDKSSFAEAYKYAKKAYCLKYVDRTAIAKLIANILRFTGSFIHVFGGIKDNFIYLDFSNILEQFCKSEKGQEHINVWRNDMCGTREHLITQMEKDPQLSRWVYQYTHLRRSGYVEELLGYDHTKEPQDEKYFCTENWISILTIAAVLKEYEEKPATEENLQATTTNIYAAGDLVMNKHVENQVDKVEAGAVGIKINKK